MGGIVQEFDLLQQLQPNAAPLPVISTGGAVLDVAQRMGSVPADLRDDLDYVALFHRHCREPSWRENIELRAKKAIECENI
ncbi:MAG: hypothetical protein WA733_24475 [Methylocystis sp.]